MYNMKTMNDSIKQKIQIIKAKGKNPWSNLVRWKDPIVEEIINQTYFLPKNSIMPQRAWHIINDNLQILVCSICNEHPLTWHKSINGYSQTCSTKCSAIKQFGEKQQDMRTVKQKQKDEIEKRRNTNLERYGHINVLASNKVKQIKIKKYGTDKITTTDNFKIKRKHSMLNKFGVEYSGQSKELIEKRKQTLIEKFGVNSFSKTDEFKQQLINIYQEQFGVDHHMQVHLSKDTIEKLNDRNWLYQQHIINERPISDIAKELKFDISTLIEYYKKYNIETRRFPSSQPEKEIKNFIMNLGIKLITNTRKIIFPYELDIYIPSHNLAIEYCGLYWHSSKHERITHNYHKDKLDLCNKQNIRLITIFEDEWIHKQEIVKSKLLSILGKDNRKKIFARKTKIVSVSTKDKQKFFDQYHIQGTGPGSINIGLQYQNQLVACMSFIKQKNNHILNRYATSTIVVGGFSKLLTFFQHNNNWKQIISFADLRWSKGYLYEKTGFILNKTLSPDYYYVDIKNIKRIHKFNFRHKNLPNILGENYNPNISEAENTTNNNWFKIYNCGLNRYVLNNLFKT